MAVKHLNELGSDQLLGRDMEPVGVALDGVEQPGCWVGEFSQLNADGSIGLGSVARRRNSRFGETSDGTMTVTE